MRFQIKIPGYSWSNKFSIQKTNLGKQCQFFIQDKFKCGTTFNYIFNLQENTQEVTLTIYCKGFIVNQLSDQIKVYGNRAADQVQQAGQRRFYPLGGQNNQQEKQDKIFLIGSQTGTKIRICQKTSLVDFSQPIVIGGIGMSQSRVVLKKQIKGKQINLFAIVRADTSIKQMHKDLQIFAKQVIIRARAIVINNTKRKLFVKQYGSQQQIFEIDVHQKQPFYFTMPQMDKKNKLHQIIFRGQDTKQSLPINIMGLGAIYFKLKEKDQSTTYYKINIQQVKEYIFYDIQQLQEDQLPYQITILSDSLSAYIPRFNRTITKNDKLFYINERPQLQQQFQVIISHKYGKMSMEVVAKPDNFKYRQQVRFHINYNGLPGAVFVSIYVYLSDRRRYLVIKQTRASTQDQNTPQFETQQLNIKLDKISFSFIHNHLNVTKPFQSFYFYMQNLQFYYLESNKRKKFQAKLQFLQLDQDQPFTLMNPVVITPYRFQQYTVRQQGKIPKYIFNSFIQIDKSFVQNLFITQLTIDFNDLVVKISQDFIKLTLQLIKQFQQVVNTQQEDFIIKGQIDAWKNLDIPTAGSKTFIQSIIIAPFVVEISAQLNFKSQQDKNNFLFLGTILSALGVVMTNIQGAPIVLDGLEIVDAVDSLQGINTKIVNHYKMAVLKQFYKIFGSLNIIGNPMGLFRNISTGFKDLKDKPAEGFVQGPIQFGLGLAKGTTSLIAHSIGGALNSLASFTGTVASGLAVLTFDQEFQKRRQKQKMHKPKHIFEGLEKGGAAVFYGIRDGITGVFTKPYQNSKKQGIIGFFKGAVQGVSGLVIKPATGIIDFASKTTEGLKNTALYMQDKPNQNRIRYPRVFYTQCYTVRQYNIYESKINFIFHKTKYLSRFPDSYFIQSFLIHEQEGLFIVIMKKDVIMVAINDQKINWIVPISQTKAQNVSINRKNGIRLQISGPNKDDKFIEINDQDHRNAIVALIESIKKEYH